MFISLTVTTGIRALDPWLATGDQGTLPEVPITILDTVIVDTLNALFNVAQDAKLKQQSDQSLLYSHGSGAVGRRSPLLSVLPPLRQSTAAMDTAPGAGASASTLATTMRPAGETRTVGPGLVLGMSEAEVFERLNGWGIARDGDLLGLRSNLGDTQAIVATAFDQARATLMTIVGDFRLGAETMRQHSLYEATQGLARLEHVIAEARQRFDAQDVRFTQDLGELARRQQALATTIAAAPAPPWVQPGGDVPGRTRAAAGGDVPGGDVAGRNGLVLPRRARGRSGAAAGAADAHGGPHHAATAHGGDAGMGCLGGWPGQSATRRLGRSSRSSRSSAAAAAAAARRTTTPLLHDSGR